VQIEELAESYLDREVLCCDSALVTALIGATFEGFGVDDWQNLYPDPSDWSPEQCETRDSSVACLKQLQLTRVGLH
jgi:hypothetical protein